MPDGVRVVFFSKMFLLDQTAVGIHSTFWYELWWYTFGQLQYFWNVPRFFRGVARSLCHNLWEVRPYKGVCTYNIQKDVVCI